MINLKMSVLIFIFMLLSPIVTQAEIPSDKQAKLYINADQANLNKSTGISIFTGHVVLDHGSTHVTCDKLTTYSDKAGKLNKAIAESLTDQLATYETMTDIDKPPLQAKAKRIEYYPDRHYVILLQHAYVVQGQNSIIGEHLEYDIKNQLLITKPADNSPNARTQIIIQPPQ